MITKEKLADALEKASGVPLNRVRHGSAILLVDPTGKKVASIPNRENSKTLPMPVAYQVVKEFTRGNDAGYRAIKDMLR